MIKVLIAEDDFRVASIHEQFLLKINDIKIVGKTMNAKETMNFLESNSVDLLILDVYLPDELGTDILPRIRSRFPIVDVIMITAATDKNFLTSAIRHGIFNYLIKPVTLRKFSEVMEDYRNKKTLLSSNQELNQEVIDQYFGNTLSVVREQSINLPKGIDQLTLEKVISIIEEGLKGLTAEEVGRRMGASRTTARRYLEYLISIGKCKAELVYGIVGRPERNYYPVSNSLTM